MHRSRRGRRDSTRVPGPSEVDDPACVSAAAARLVSAAVRLSACITILTRETRPATHAPARAYPPDDARCTQQNRRRRPKCFGPKTYYRFFPPFRWRAFLSKILLFTNFFLSFSYVIRRRCRLFINFLSYALPTKSIPAGNREPYHGGEGRTARGVGAGYII